jgi:hypothetical protein
LAGFVKHFGPGAPDLGETFGEQKSVNGLPSDRVERFAEVELEDCQRVGAFVTGLDNVSHVDKVLYDGAPRDKASLVGCT